MRKGLDSWTPSNFLKELRKRGTRVIESYDSRFEILQEVRINSDKEGMTELLNSITSPSFDVGSYTNYENEIRNNLVRRGIITGTIFEGYKYSIDGTIVDYSELAKGNPRHKLKPIRKYDKFFYEAYVSLSVPSDVSIEEINNNAIKMAVAIKLLKELDIEVKVNLFMHSTELAKDTDYMFICPLYSHNEQVSIKELIAYTSGDMLRTFLFHRMRKIPNVYGHLGSPTKLDNTISLWEFDEIEFCQTLIDKKGNEK